MVLDGVAAPALALVDLVLPRRCGGCSRAGPALCAVCTALLTAGAEPVPTGWLVPGAPPTTAAGPYRGRVRATVLAWKDGRHDLTPRLGGALAGAVVVVLERREQAPHPSSPPARGGARPAPTTAPALLVPVPSSRSATRARGTALTHDLAAACARALAATGTGGVALAPPRSLVPAGTGAGQAGLGAAAREANRRGAHRAAPALRGRDCVLVDDVVTTGATLAEAARAVAASGGRVVGAVAVAATAPPGRDRGDHRLAFRHDG